jgi:hypothetical protein
LSRITLATLVAVLVVAACMLALYFTVVYYSGT